jgi:FAD/FMN-containing dehydrogenase
VTAVTRIALPADLKAPVGLAVTPAARLGAGVSPDRMLLGSEGILGVIAEVRVQRPPVYRSAVFVTARTTPARWRVFIRRRSAQYQR